MSTLKGKKLVFDLADAQKILDGLIPSMIVERTSRGIDKNGNRFIEYSAGYKRQLERMGEDTNVDLWLTGGFLADVHTLSSTIKDGVMTQRIGAGSKSSAQVSPPRIKRKKDGEKKAERARQVKSPGQGPDHNLLGRWIHEGTNGPAREWLGLTPAEWREVITQVKKSKLLKLK